MSKLFDNEINESLEEINDEVYVVNEDLVEELTLTQVSIEQDINLLVDTCNKIDIYSNNIGNENLSDELKNNIEFAKFSLENINVMRTELGLPTKEYIFSSEETIESINILSIEEKQGIISKMVLAMKKLWYKIVAAIKGFITKFIHNGKRLAAKKLSIEVELKQLSESNKVAINNISLSDMEFLFNKFPYLQYDSLIGFAASSKYNDKLEKIVNIIKDSVLLAMDCPRTTKLSDSILENAKKEASKRDDWYRYGFLKDTNNRLHTTFYGVPEYDLRNKFLGVFRKLLIKNYNESLKVHEDHETACLVYRYDNNNIHGLIDTKDGFDLHKMNVKLTFSESYSCKEVMSINSIREILDIIISPFKALEKILDLGNEDIKKANIVYDELMKIEDVADDSAKELSDVLRLHMKLVPSMVNGEVINYYNIVNNTLDVINMYIKYYK